MPGQSSRPYQPHWAGRARSIPRRPLPLRQCRHRSRSCDYLRDFFFLRSCLCPSKTPTVGKPAGPSHLFPGFCRGYLSNLPQLHPARQIVGRSARDESNFAEYSPERRRSAPPAETPVGRGTSHRRGTATLRTARAPWRRCQAGARALRLARESPRRRGRRASVQRVGIGSCSLVRPKVFQQVTQAVAGFEKAGFDRLFVDFQYLRDLLVTAFGKVAKYQHGAVVR